MTQLNVNSFQHTNGTNAITFATPRIEPTRLVLPNVTTSTLPPVIETVAGEMFFNSTDKRLYVSTGTSYVTKSSFSQPSGTFSYNFSSTTSNSTTTQSPMNIYYRRNIFQTIYTVSDLTGNGAESGAIFRNLKWNITNAVPSGNSILGFTLRLFHTTTSDASAVAAPIAGESTTTVYSDTSSTEFTLVETTGIKTITFGGGNNTGVTRSSTFEWNGVNNICIESCTSQNQTTWTSNGTQTIFNVTNGSRYYRDDSSGNACTITPNQTLGFKPSVQMDFS
jgi:hypothetical protein